MIGLQDRVDLVAGWARGIRTAAGFRTDLGAHVDTERVGAGPGDTALRLGVFVEDGPTPTNTTPQRRDWQFSIVMEARVPVRMATAEATVLAVLEDLCACVPTATKNPADNILTLEIAGSDISRQPDGIPFIVVGVTLRGTCYEYLSRPA